MYLLAILIDNRKLRLAWRRADRQRIVGIAQNRSTPAGEDSSAQCARHEKDFLIIIPPGIGLKNEASWVRHP